MTDNLPAPTEAFCNISRADDDRVPQTTTITVGPGTARQANIDLGFNADDEGDAVFNSDAERLADTLIKCLPGGTVDALTCKLIEHKRCRLYVPIGGKVPAEEIDELAETLLELHLRGKDPNGKPVKIANHWVRELWSQSGTLRGLLTEMTIGIGKQDHETVADVVGKARDYLGLKNPIAEDNQS